MNAGSTNGQVVPTYNDLIRVRHNHLEMAEAIRAEMVAIRHHVIPPELRQSYLNATRDERLLIRHQVMSPELRQRYAELGVQKAEHKCLARALLKEIQQIEHTPTPRAAIDGAHSTSTSSGVGSSGEGCDDSFYHLCCIAAVIFILFVICVITKANDKPWLVFFSFNAVLVAVSFMSFMLKDCSKKPLILYITSTLVLCGSATAIIWRIILIMGSSRDLNDDPVGNAGGSRKESAFEITGASLSMVHHCKFCQRCSVWCSSLSSK